MKKQRFCILLVWLCILFPLSAGLAENAIPGVPDINVETGVICRGVENLAPLGVGTFSLMISENSTASPGLRARAHTKVVHNWYQRNSLAASISLPVCSGNWRTYSSKIIMENSVGEWRVDIQTTDGTLLKTIYFVVN